MSIKLEIVLCILFNGGRWLVVSGQQNNKKIIPFNGGRRKWEEKKEKSKG